MHNGVLAMHPWPMAQTPAEQLREDAILWTVDEVTTVELVRSACDALVDGLDSQELRLLAGANGSTSNFEIDDLLRAIASDLGFKMWPHGSEGARFAASLVLAARCVAGQIDPREFAAWMHERIRHGHPDRRVEALVSLDDRYDTVNYTGESIRAIDGAVLEAAGLLLESGIS